MANRRTLPYVDTSALAKWYLNEEFSDEVEAYLQLFSFAAISSLTVVELRCLLARRRRYDELTALEESQCYALFEEDVSEGHLQVVPLEDSHTLAALRILERLPEHSLRTLDALHLAIARSAGFEVLATADRQMAAAAGALGWIVKPFIADST